MAFTCTKLYFYLIIHKFGNLWWATVFQAFMQCSAETVYQEVILQPEKMVHWNRTVSVCQVITFGRFLTFPF